MKTLRDQVKARRQAIGMTQAQLAEAAGYSRTGLCAYEQGRKDIAGETLDRIIAALGKAELRWARR